MVEVWKDIKGYEGLYQVSNLGNVKSIKFNKERILRPGIMSGYLMVHFYKDGKVKNHYIHRLVAETFITNPLKLPCVNHKDENKLNNCVDNLEWCTIQYNNTYNDKHLKASKKLSIPIYCIELDKIFSSSHDAERQTGINHSNINSCIKGKLKSAGGYHWQYA